MMKLSEKNIGRQYGQIQKMLGDASGMALLLTLAAISFLVAITVGLATSVNWQIQASTGQKETVRLHAVLLSGLSLVRASLYGDQQKQKFDTLLDSWNTLDMEMINKLFAGDKVSISVQDMSGRIQVNRLVLSDEEKKKLQKGRLRGRREGGKKQGDPEKLQRELWKRFLLSGKFAVEGEDEVIALLDALSDWLDDDDLVRDHGAETGYYQSLKTPYICRNGPLQYPAELLLVKGFSRKIVYGDKEHEGIIDYLTIYGQDGKININTAPPPILQALAPGMNDEVTGQLIEFREDKDNLNALENPQWYRQAGDFPGDIVFDKNLITTVSSYFFLKIITENNGFQQTAQGFLYRDPKTREQNLLSWKEE
jgi:general secretion pathway protein K